MLYKSNTPQIARNTSMDLYPTAEQYKVQGATIIVTPNEFGAENVNYVPDRLYEH